MKITTKQLCIAGVSAALIFAITRFIQIPIPLGYFNIGNCVIMSCCLLMPPVCGVLAGSLGSALADLTSFPVYTVPTLIIKFLMPLIFYKLYAYLKARLAGKINRAELISAIIAMAVCTLVPLFGYTITGGILYGGFYAGLAQFPGLLLEYIANLIIFAILFTPVNKIAKLISD